MSTLYHPNFITIEGVDGAGKSSHVEPIAQYLIEKGYKVTLTREPGGTPLGEKLRDILLHQKAHIDPETETMLMFASRKEHLQKVIKPALERGEIVICDRFTDSSWAYQGGGRGVSLSYIQQLEQATHGELKPGLTLLFDLPVEESQKRLNLTGKNPDTFEQLGSDFFKSVRNVYLQRAKENNAIKIIDSLPSLQQVRNQVLKTINQHLPNLSPPRPPLKLKM